MIKEKMKITEQLEQLINGALSELGISLSEIHLEHPADQSHGDYATNVPMVAFKQQQDFTSPRDLAQAILDKIDLENSDFVAKMEVAGPGFINFTLSQSFLVSEMGEIIKNQARPAQQKNKGKKSLIEYMQPNTNKPLHVGHLRNAILGSALINLLDSQGWEVVKATVNNDRGLHIIKSMWGYLTSKSDSDLSLSWQELIEAWDKSANNWPKPDTMEVKKLQKPDHFVGHWYVMADKHADDDQVQKAWQEMLQAWENESDPKHDQVRKLWNQLNNWFYQGYQQSADRVGFSFDKEYVSYESDIYEAGRQIILDSLKKGLFTELENGAVQAKLDKYGLPDKVLLRGDGTGIYMTFDIELTRQRSELDADKLIWVVGNDQKLYFEQLFAICEMLGYGQREDYRHFAYGMVRLPEGKMSSRKGLVIYADDVVDLAVEKAFSIMKENGSANNFSEVELAKVAEIVGLGAVKWSMLSADPLSEVKFDVDESVSFTGFAGPYIQYTYARSQSILEKAKIDIAKQPYDTLFNLSTYSKLSLSKKEEELLRNLYTYFEVVEKSAEEYAPHHLTTYLFSLAQLFNAFYSDHKVIGAKEGKETEQFRLALVIATSMIIKRGLKILGIEVVSQM